MKAPRVSRIFTVNGMTASLCRLSAHFGLRYQKVHSRFTKLGWTVEQSLGIEPAPPRTSRCGRFTDPLPRSPRLAPPDENFVRAVLGQLTAEQYLTREGVPANDYALKDRESRL